jgi:hypothetical protein
MQELLRGPTSLNLCLFSPPSSIQEPLDEGDRNALSLAFIGGDSAEEARPVSACRYRVTFDTESNRRLLGWNFHPLVLDAFVAH